MPSILRVMVLGSAIGGWMRVEGGMYFLSDVLVGLAWGSLVGYSIPALHRQKYNFQTIPFMNKEVSGIGISKIF